MGDSLDFKKIEKTFAIIKPDAVRKGDAGSIMQITESKGFTILACEQVQVRLSST